jgi:SUKH superfamily protein
MVLESTNGFADLTSRYDYAWSLEAIVTENQRAWADAAMPLDDHLLAFGGDGAGAWFCLSLRASDENAVFHWGWIDGTARRVADGLITFWRSWLDGSLEV